MPNDPKKPDNTRKPKTGDEPDAETEGHLPGGDEPHPPVDPGK